MLKMKIDYKFNIIVIYFYFCLLHTLFGQMYKNLSEISK